MTSEILAELPDFLKPKLRLFMSVDITGSTQFKQLLSHSPHKGGATHKEESDEGSPSEPWLSPILEFYEQISATFEDQWNLVAKHAREEPHEWAVGDRPTVWKAVGDELIFTKILTDHRQAYLSVLTWLRTIQAYRQRIKVHSAGLDLKCAAWIAGFPINNAEVVLDHQSSSGLTGCDDGDYIFGNLARLHAGPQPQSGSSSERSITGIRDFIGPSIDTGFRVASVSSPRKFVLAADLAFVLAHTAVNLPESWGYEKLVFYYEGRKDLKGVTNGTPYPIFWVNAVLPDPLMEIEDRIEKRAPTAASDVKTFCERFLERNKDTHVMKPFIYGDPDGLFRRLPTRHVEKLKKLASYWRQENARRETEEKAQLEPESNTAQSAADTAGGDLEALSSQLIPESTLVPSPQPKGE